MSDTSSNTLQHEPVCAPGLAQVIEKLREEYTAGIRKEQERMYQAHKIETTRLQNTIATKAARIEELEQALEEALRNQTKGLRWEAVQTDDCWKCPKCFNEVFDEAEEWDSVGFSKVAPDGCKRCGLKRGDVYEPNENLMQDDESEMDEGETEDEELEDDGFVSDETEEYESDPEDLMDEVAGCLDP